MTQVLIVSLLFAIVLFFAIRRQLGEQRITVTRLWIAPLLMCGIIPLSMPTGLGPFDWLAGALALGAGIGLGIWRLGFSRVEPDPAAGVIRVSGSPIAVLVLLAIVGAKTAAKQLVAVTPALSHLEVASFAFLMLALGSVLGSRGRLFWIYLLAKRTVQQPS